MIMFRLSIGRVSLASLVALGGSASFLLSNRREALAASSPFDYPVSRQIRHEGGEFLEKKITLFQYHSCPFCCKVRAVFDFYGINYDIVEVNSVFRTQLKWSDYKKVPVVVVEEKHQPGKLLQVNDSSVIISALETVLLDKKKQLDTVITYYPSMEGVDQHTGKKKLEFPNRYAIMYGIEMPKEVCRRRRLEEKWRNWVDNDFVHTLAPNIYRTPREALAAFRYVSEVGGWEDIFPAWQRYIVIYVGACAMYFLGKVIARRHGLDKDVRQSLYDGCRHWVRAMGKDLFMGGERPDLSDLAVFGVLSSIEGCDAFRDAMREVPKMERWFNRMKAACRTAQGRAFLPK